MMATLALPLIDWCLSIKSKVGKVLVLQKYFKDIQHHGKLAEKQSTVSLKKK